MFTTRDSNNARHSQWQSGALCSGSLSWHTTRRAHHQPAGADLYPDAGILNLIISNIDDGKNFLEYPYSDKRTVNCFIYFKCLQICFQVVCAVQVKHSIHVPGLKREDLKADLKGLWSATAERLGIDIPDLQKWQKGIPKAVFIFLANQFSNLSPQKNQWRKEALGLVQVRF